MSQTDIISLGTIRPVAAYTLGLNITLYRYPVTYIDMMP